MFKINIGNVYSNIEEPLPEVVNKVLRSKLSAELVGAFFARRANPYAGVRYFYTLKGQRFPTGMLSIVRDVLDKYQIEYEHVDCRPPVQLGPKLPLYNVILRDYQQNAVNLAVEKQRGLIRMGTGSGKTTCIASLLAKLNVNSLVLIHRTDIFYQLINTFERLLQIPIGKIGDGNFEFNKKITVANIQSLAHVFDPKVKVAAKEDKILQEKRNEIIELLNKQEAVVIDEAHHVSSDSFWTVLQQMPNCFFRYGFSGTMFREDNMDILLEGATAKKFVDISSSWLIDNQFLVPPMVYLFLVEHERRQKGDPYSLVYSQEVVENMDRNRLICNLALKAKEAGKGSLISVTQILHGELLEQMLQKVDPTAIFVNGQSDPQVRKQILKEMGEGKNRIIVGTNIFSEGVDMPCLSVIINAAGAASGIHSLQLLGRALRPANNKTKAWVVDLQDNGKFLNNHSKERIAIYSTEQRYQLIPVKDISEVKFE